jgi:hypothetical protein
MDAAKISAAIARFAKDHRTTLTDIGNRQTQLLEIGSAVAVVQHYRANGYNTTIQNPAGSSEFKVKLSTRGHPANYSRVLCERGNLAFEIHTNLSVESGRRDHGIYCVDVAVVKAGVVPSKKTKAQAAVLNNNDLITFAEAKKLVIYPMLLAHFIGIVHEVAPQYMTDYKRTEVPNGHLPPTLITLGNFTKNARVIQESFERRKYKICIAEQFDYRLSCTRRALSQSPFSKLDILQTFSQQLKELDDFELPDSRPQVPGTPSEIIDDDLSFLPRWDPSRHER